MGYFISILTSNINYQLLILIVVLIIKEKYWYFTQ